MTERLQIAANIPSDLVKSLYLPLRETYPGSLEDFNALIMYLGMIGSIALWEMGLDALSEKGKGIPAKNTKERRELMVKTMAKFLNEILEKTDSFDDSNMAQKQIVDFCENFRRNL